MIRRATMALGAASVASAVFYFVTGKFQFVSFPAAGAAVAVALGVLAVVAGRLGSRTLTIVAGAAFLLAAATLMVLLVRGGFLIGNGSAFSLWLGLGIGLVVLGVSDPRPAD